MKRYHSQKRSALLLLLVLAIASVFPALGRGAARASPAHGPQMGAERTLVRNAALVLTMDPSVGAGPLGLLENADVLLEGDRIAAVGHNLSADDARVVDASGMIVMPGFVDTHNHLWQSLIRGCATDEDVTVWLGACVFSLAGSRLNGDDTYAAVRLATADLIRTGVTTVLDSSHSFNPGFVRGNIRALDESGMRFIYAYRGRNNPAMIADIKQVKQELIDPNPRAAFQVASHPGIRQLNDLRAMAQLARELDVPLNVHLLENDHDRADDPVSLLEQVGALGPNLIANHAIHLTDAEISKLAAAGVRLTHNPLSNMRLASGIMRLPELRAAGVPVGLGLDGGTNDTNDFFNTMRTALGLQRALHLDAKIYPTVEDVLRMATIGGAELLGMADEVGSLTPGKKADLILINPGRVNFAPRIDWVSQLVFNGQPQNVEWVFVDGRPLMKNGKLVHINETKVVQAAEEVGTKVRELLGK